MVQDGIMEEIGTIIRRITHGQTLLGSPIEFD